MGGGLGSLTGAAYLLRDCGFEGKNIHIIEALPIMGGSNHAQGDPNMVGFAVVSVCSIARHTKISGTLCPVFPRLKTKAAL